MDNERITSANISPGELRQETNLRPQRLDDYIGQKRAPRITSRFLSKRQKLRGRTP